MLKIFIGWDPRETEAYDVFAHSITSRASRPVEIIPLVQAELRAQGIYSRPATEKAATEFSMTRWLVPYLSGYEGISIFADCDMLCLADIHELMDNLKPLSVENAGPDGILETLPAVWCCQHDYTPKTLTKMDGQPQVNYPRKNWSSFMVFNNGHELCRALTPDLINRADHPPSYFHQFRWLETQQPGPLPLEWNWLGNEYDAKSDVKNIHYTLGGPWFDQTKDCDYADLWLEEQDRMRGLVPAVA
jgi:hypothetical protein